MGEDRGREWGEQGQEREGLSTSSEHKGPFPLFLVRHASLIFGIFLWRSISGQVAYGEVSKYIFYLPLPGCLVNTHPHP